MPAIVLTRKVIYVDERERTVVVLEANVRFEVFTILCIGMVIISIMLTVEHVVGKNPLLLF